MTVVLGESVRLSTDDFAERDRVEATREIYGKSILKVDVEPLAEHDFAIDMRLRVLPDLAVASGSATRQRCSHISQLADNDDLILLVTIAGGGVMRHLGREVAVSDGEAVLTTSGEAGAFTYHGDLTFANVRVPRRVLQPLVADPTALLMRKVSRDNEAQRLLLGYAGMVQRAPGRLPADLQQHAAHHIHDLLGLALGATGDGAQTAARRGLRAARLAAIKSDVMARLTEPGLTAEAVAARHRISERYFRKLFAAAGTSFSDFVLDQRLALCHRRLVDPSFIGHTVSAIAFGAGFGDLSYFNRAFRRRYGATPTEIRAARQTSS
jgi:AraC-like DNA-binding protein